MIYDLALIGRPSCSGAQDCEEVSGIEGHDHRKSARMRNAQQELPVTDTARPSGIIPKDVVLLIGIDIHYRCHMVIAKLRIAWEQVLPCSPMRCDCKKIDRLPAITFGLVRHHRLIS